MIRVLPTQTQKTNFCLNIINTNGLYIRVLFFWVGMLKSIMLNMFLKDNLHIPNYSDMRTDFIKQIFLKLWTSYKDASKGNLIATRKRNWNVLPASFNM